MAWEQGVKQDPQEILTCSAVWVAKCCRDGGLMGTAWFFPLGPPRGAPAESEAHRDGRRAGSRPGARAGELAAAVMLTRRAGGH